MLFYKFPEKLVLHYNCTKHDSLTRRIRKDSRHTCKYRIQNISFECFCNSGLKPGQRKVLFTCLKRNDKREVKVAQLAGSVAELSAYHHGEVSNNTKLCGDTKTGTEESFYLYSYIIILNVLLS